MVEASLNAAAQARRLMGSRWTENVILGEIVAKKGKGLQAKSVTLWFYW